MKAVLKGILKTIGLYGPLHAGYSKYKEARWHRNYRKNRLELMKTYDSGKKYLNVGGGKFLQKDWRILDYVSPSYPYDRELIDLNINLLEMQPWPVSNGEYDLVYSSHAMEHLTDKVGKFVFKEIARILKSGGIFRITVPDVDPVYMAYKQNDLAFIETNANSPDKRNIFTHFIGTFSSLAPMEINREVFDADSMQLEKREFLDKYIEADIDAENHDFSSHATWYNFEKIKAFGEAAGFSEIMLSSKGNSISEEMRKPGFDHKPGQANIYVDLIR